MDRAIKVLVVDDHGIVRAGLCALLSKEQGIEVAGHASNGREALEKARKAAPDVVVMDVRMPNLSGIDATRQILAQHPRARVIGLSADGDDRLAVEMLRAGAMGFVNKVAVYEELIKAIRTVMEGRVYCDRGLLTQAMSQTDSSASSSDALSLREREYLQLLAEGRSTKEIADALGISTKTAETHRRNLMIKLKVDSVAELTKHAIRLGVTSL